METLGQPESASPGTKTPVNLLPKDDAERAADWRSWRSSAAISIAIHAAVIAALLLMPGSLIRPLPPEEQASVHVTPVFEPTDLTQPIPNKGPISKEITAEAIAPRPLIKTPAPAPAARQGPVPTPAPPPPPVPAPPPVIAQVPPKPVVVEPPKVQPNQNTSQTPEIARIAPTPCRLNLPGQLCTMLHRPIPRRQTPPRGLLFLTPQWKRLFGVLRERLRRAANPSAIWAPMRAAAVWV